MTLKHLRWLIIFIPLLVSVVSAQESFGLNADEITILNRINNSRLRENLVHLMPSEALNRVADAWVEDLTARPIDALGDAYLTRSRQTIEDLLTREGFVSYPDGYSVDFIPIVVRDFGPTQIID